MQATTYRIENTRSGLTLGHYDAASEAQALDAMAVDAGYDSYAALQAQTPAGAGEIVVKSLAEVVRHALDGASEQYLREVVDHGIHNLTNNYSDSEVYYAAYASEFDAQARAALASHV